MKSQIVVLAVAIAVVLAVSTAQADVFSMGSGLASRETVPVGDPGNVADTAAHSGNSAGQGAVAYNYNIGKYEVTAGQYTEFLNAVAKTDTYGLYNANMWSDSRAARFSRAAHRATIRTAWHRTMPTVRSTM